MSASSGGGLGAENVVPMSERRRVVADKVLVMVVVVVSTGPDGEEVAQRPGEVVARVRVNGLEKTHHDPTENGQKMDIAKQVGKQQGASDGTETSNGNLNGVGVLGSETKGSGVLVMLLVDVLVKRTVVEGTVEPVVPGILHEKEDGDLGSKGLESREVGRNVNVQEVANGLEAKDGHGLDKGVGNQDVLEALKLVVGAGDLGVLDLVLSKEGDAIQKEPGGRAAKVDELMDNQEQEASGEEVVVHPGVVVAPSLLEVRHDNVARLDQRLVQAECRTASRRS